VTAVSKIDELEAILARDLSESQKEAAFSRSRYIRVVAGAGAGKTETLTRRIVVLLARGTEPGSIVAFTFTENAAPQ